MTLHKSTIPPQVTLTTFVDIVFSSGVSKRNKVRDAKSQYLTYDPRTDFYKPLREVIIETHRYGHDKNNLNSILPSINDPKKINVYPNIIAGYQKWWAGKSLSWFDPPKPVFSKYGVEIKVNPELGLTIDGAPHLVKLYFKAEPLTPNKIKAITHLMASEACPLCPPPDATTMAVLDIRNHKLISGEASTEFADMLEAELFYIAKLWPKV